LREQLRRRIGKGRVVGLAIKPTRHPTHHAIEDRQQVTAGGRRDVPRGFDKAFSLFLASIHLYRSLPCEMLMATLIEFYCENIKPLDAVSGACHDAATLSSRPEVATDETRAPAPEPTETLERRDEACSSSVASAILACRSELF
jgi:hypothetical protein